MFRISTLRTAVLLACVSLQATGAALGAQSDLLQISHHGDFLGRQILSATFNYNEDSGEVLYAGDRSGGIAQVDLTTRSVRDSTSMGRSAVVDLVSMPDDSMVFAVDRSGVVSAWQPRSGPATVLTKVGDGAVALAVSADGKTLAVAGSRSVEILHLESRARLATLTDPRQREDLIYVSFVDGSRTLVTLSRDRLLVLWNLQEQAPLRVTEERFAKVFSADFSLSGLLVIGAVDLLVRRGALVGADPLGRWQDRIKVIDLKNGLEIKTLDGQGSEQDVTSISLSSDNKYVAAGGARGVVVWDVLRGATVAELEVPERVNDLEFSPNGRWLAAATDQGVRVWRTGGIVPDEAFTPLLTGQKFLFATTRAPLLDFQGEVSLAFLGFDAAEDLREASMGLSRIMEELLAQDSSIRLVERDAVNRILEELEFQLSGLTEVGAAAVGRLANAQKLLLGDIRRVGSTTILTVRLLDVASGVTEGIRTLQCNQCRQDDLPLAVQKLAETVVRKK